MTWRRQWTHESGSIWTIIRLSECIHDSVNVWTEARSTIDLDRNELRLYQAVTNKETQHWVLMMSHEVMALQVQSIERIQKNNTELLHHKKVSQQVKYAQELAIWCLEVKQILGFATEPQVRSLRLNSIPLNYRKEGDSILFQRTRSLITWSDYSRRRIRSITKATRNLKRAPNLKKFSLRSRSSVWRKRNARRLWTCA